MIKGEKETKDKEYYHVERSYDSFQHSICVPCKIESDKVDASFKRGILKVTFPKSVKVLENLRKIEVKS
ncbi:MAG: Hsp20/alpha crystallin family protein [Planctomycetota bacterium]